MTWWNTASGGAGTSTTWWMFGSAIAGGHGGRLPRDAAHDQRPRGLDLRMLHRRRRRARARPAARARDRHHRLLRPLDGADAAPQPGGVASAAAAGRARPAADPRRPPET